MENYQIIVNNLASERGEDTNLVLNLFQSLLDEFTRRCSKNDFEPAKVGGPTPHLGPPTAAAPPTAAPHASPSGWRRLFS